MNTKQEEAIQKLSEWRDNLVAHPELLDDVLTEEVETVTDLMVSPITVAVLASLLGVQETCKMFFMFGVAWQKQASDADSPLSDLLKDVNI